jgi:hypothetical protein
VIDGVAKIIKTGADVYEGLIVGVVVVVAVAFNQLRLAGRSGKSFFPGALGLVMIVNLALLAGALAALFGRNLLPEESAVDAKTLGMAAGLMALALLSAVKFMESRRASRVSQLTD